MKKIFCHFLLTFFEFLLNIKILCKVTLTKRGEMILTKALEDYLELIYNSIKEDKQLKATDIASSFNISRASVSEALIRLVDMDLIIYEGRKGITITPKGEFEAKKIIKKHLILSEFFSKVLNFDDVTSSQNACKIEHVIDEDVISRLEKFIAFCKENNINTMFKEKQL